MANKGWTVNKIAAKGFSDQVLVIEVYDYGTYQIDYCGRIKRADEPGHKFSDTWECVGFSQAWQVTKWNMTLQDAFEHPDQIKEWFVWDYDHGEPSRLWGQSTRVKNAYVTDLILDCGHKPSPHGEHTNGRATERSTGEEICWDCAAQREQRDMIKNGHWSGYVDWEDYKFITNWTDRTFFPIDNKWWGDHNICGSRKRLTVRFVGPDGYWWWGTHIDSGFTQLIHCHRTKRKATPVEIEYNNKRAYRMKQEHAQINLPGMEG